jgi:Holliday junction resolvasome RuvABC endonuclease subunit
MGEFVTLSLDLGTTFGWSLGINGQIVRSGELTLAPGASTMHPGHRWLKFQEWLFQFKDVNEILYEDVMFFGQNGHKAARVYCGLLAVVQMFSLVHGIRVRCLSPSAVKSEFAGSGRADKFRMCEVAINLGWKNGKRGTDVNHNEVDAIALMWVIFNRDKKCPRFS